MTGLREELDLERIRGMEQSAVVVDTASHTIFGGEGQDYEEPPDGGASSASGACASSGSRVTTTGGCISSTNLTARSFDHHGSSVDIP